MKRLLFSVIALVQLSLAYAAEPFVTFVSQADALPVHGATISCSDNEYEGVKIAVENLKADFQRVGLPVTGGQTTIIVGTLGKNKEIDRLK